MKATEPLLSVQKRIHNRLLHKVEFPTYLHGGISGTDGKARTTVTNAATHLRSAILIDADVGKFFPTIGADQVQRIWRDFFHFPPDVATCLTKLTTRHNQLPQGAVTSTHLANLVFFDREPELVANFAAQGFRYTRFIDDISISSPTPIPKREVTAILSRVIGMMADWGVHPNREKTKALSPSKPQLVNKLSINSKKVTAPGKFRARLRAMVDQLRRANKAARTSADFDSTYKTASGRVAYIKKLHPKLSAELREILRTCRPLPTDRAVIDLRRKVVRAARTKRSEREGVGFRQLLNRLSSEVGAIRHARPKEAERLLTILRNTRSSLS